MRRIFGVVPDNIELYKLALLHRSASVFLDDGTAINNERLEFLGDAILEAIVSDFLFIEFPSEDEGFLTQMRSKIVSRASLNELAARIGLTEHVVYNTNGNHSQRHLYGDALEAMIGALYLDKGYDFTNRLFINNIFRRHLDLNEITATEIDFKSRLIEWCQKSRRQITFDTAFSPRSTGTNPDFISRVLIDGIEMCYGHGHSKKEAEQNASFMLSELVTSDTRTDHILELTDEDIPSPEIPADAAPDKKKRASRRKKALV